MKGVYSCLSTNWLNTKHWAVSMNGTPFPLSLCEYTMSLAVSGPRALISFKYFLKAPSTSPSAGGEQGSNSIWAPHPTLQTPSIIWPAMAQAPGKGLYSSPNKVGDNIETTFYDHTVSYYIILFIFLFSHFPLHHIQDHYFSDITRNTPSPNDITLLGWYHSWQFCEQNWTLVFRSFLFIFWYILQRGWQIPPGIT